MPDLDIIQYPVRPDMGRHLVRDPRSLAYRRRYAGDPLRPTEWAPKAPVLDQQRLLSQGIHTSRLFPGAGDDLDALASCTGNAATAAVSILHDTATLEAAGLGTRDPAAAQRWAISLYADATRYDQWHDDAWPATDCGSSGLGVAKALKARGLIDQYGHATTAEELCALLQTGPVLAGLPWHDAWFDPPGLHALLDDSPRWQTSPVVGGHEVCITALETVVTLPDGGLDYARTILRAQNSWSRAYGDHGSFRFSLALYQAVRSQTDLVAPRLEYLR
ncbi:hypothetical protein P1P75_11915 [Streptomyces sp. ID05-39B]|uniref:hypothetical protein n=1 Tax=Streptomyces sp. ID05-39B TaxID=3028664 RepID=UPI0029A43F7F|nr:hypothetical protein [Streptomyces sp. ID05-39B]MDX3527129.1 hypothetical protein [Streptomyces sp. ID05-39B]